GQRPGPGPPPRARPPGWPAERPAAARPAGRAAAARRAGALAVRPRSLAASGHRLAIEGRPQHDSQSDLAASDVALDRVQRDAHDLGDVLVAQILEVV